MAICRLLKMCDESKACMLHQVDISEGLEELNLNACLPGDNKKG